MLFKSLISLNTTTITTTTTTTTTTTKTEFVKIFNYEKLNEKSLNYTTSHRFQFTILKLLFLTLTYNNPLKESKMLFKSLISVSSSSSKNRTILSNNSSLNSIYTLNEVTRIYQREFFRP
ncbi:hypothetical protein ACTFIZ_011155 [Dictyostelium cf. discoideum]